MVSIESEVVKTSPRRSPRLPAAIVLFAYVRYVNPKLGVPVRTVRATVLRRVEKTLPGGGLDLSASYLLVLVDGKEVHLTARLPQWKETADGDTVEVELGDDAGVGAPVPRSWKRIAPAP